MFQPHAISPTPTHPCRSCVLSLSEVSLAHYLQETHFLTPMEGNSLTSRDGEEALWLRRLHTNFHQSLHLIPLQWPHPGTTSSPGYFMASHIGGSLFPNRISLYSFSTLQKKIFWNFSFANVSFSVISVDLYSLHPLTLPYPSPFSDVSVGGEHLAMLNWKTLNIIVPLLQTYTALVRIYSTMRYVSHPPKQITTDLLSITIDLFVFSRVLYKWNHTYVFLFVWTHLQTYLNSIQFLNISVIEA